MTKKQLECIICGAQQVFYKDEDKQYKCRECNAIISSEVFEDASKSQKKGKIKFSLLKLLGAILAAAYLFYFLLRRFIFFF